MNRRHKLLAICTMLALGVLTLVFTGCSEQTVEEEFGDWITVTAPTCEEAGVQMRVSVNDPLVTQMREIPATGHDWNEWEIETEPTCLLSGVETRTCNTCENLDMRAVPALGHSWGDWETLLDATCESNGSQMRTCLRDGCHTEYRSVNALGHDFSEWVITRAPSCTVGGLETRYCRNCNNHTEIRAIEPLGHNWSEYVVTKAATCTEEGEETCFCANDSAHIQKRTINAMGHAFGDWVCIKEPTESENGEEIRVCVRDASHIETRADIPALGSLNKLTFTLKSNNEYVVEAREPNSSISGTVYIPSTYNGLPVTEIGFHGFHGCRNMESIVFLGNNLRKVGNVAFATCDKLERIEFPEGVEVIGSAMFGICSNLKSVSFPSTVISIGDLFNNYMFYKCTALESLTVAQGNSVYKADNNCIIERETNTLMWGTNNSIIPKYVKVIATHAFSHKEIESVCIPASVESIEKEAFWACDKLTNLTFENGALTEIINRAFLQCTALARVELPDNLLTIDYAAFDECTSIKEVVFGSKIEIIGKNAFANCDNILTCEIPASVKSIDSTAFSPTAFKNITFSNDNPHYIEDGNCIIEVATNMLMVGRSNTVIPEYVTSIMHNAFENCDLVSIVIPKSITMIGDYAFRYCNSLSNVTFEDDSELDSIGISAFYGCAALTEIELPGKLNKIGQSAFSGSSITSFVIPSSVTEIGERAFSSKELTSLTVEEGNITYIVEANCLIEIATGTLIFAYGDELVIPESVKIIGKYAFSSCTNEIIIIPTSVENVETYAFSGLSTEQTLIIQGYSSREEVNAAWGTSWTYGFPLSIIVYEG